MDISRSGQSPDQGDDKEQKKAAQQQASNGASSSSSGIMGPLFVILALIVIAAAGIYFFSDGSVSDPGSAASGPVARVGGEQIEADGFNEQISSLREATTSQAQQFQQLGETRQQELVLSGLINQELLRQAATNAGVSVSDSEVDSRLQSQIEQIGGESEFENRLQQNDLTREEVRENLRQQMLVSAYVEQTATSTDEQIQQLYDQYRAQLSQAATSSQDVPSLEQLRPRLEASIQQRNQQQLLQQARNNIDVEVLLDGVSYPPSTPQTQQQQQPQVQQQQPRPQTQQQPQTQPDTQPATTSGSGAQGTGNTAQ